MSKGKGLKWIKKNKAFLSVEGINKHLHKTEGLPNSTLRNELSGKQKMSPTWEKPVDDFVKELKK